MKKLQIISEKIEKTNNNYFGRGSFETIIKENKDEVLLWLENLIPVQEQIKILDEQFGCKNLQKRNYVRIITKIFPQEYNQFVCVNILLRDINSITLTFSKSNDVKTQYNLLLCNNRLKFPGKHQKTVDFETYQQFITLYSNDLINKSFDFETDEVLEFDTTEENDENIIEEKNEHSFKEKIKKDEVPNENFSEEKIIEIIKEEIEETKENKEDKRSIKKDKTNWMNVLLKGI